MSMNIQRPDLCVQHIITSDSGSVSIDSDNSNSDNDTSDCAACPYLLKGDA